MAPNTHVAAVNARKASPASPPCKRCASAETQPVVTMRRHTVDADPWFRCDECGHVFTISGDDV